MYRRRFLEAATVTGAATIAGCAGGSGGGGGGDVKETSKVSMTGSQFQPRNISVDTGTTVTWTNDDSFKHTVTSASDNWSVDESVPGGESVEHTFKESGVYEVYCTIHGSADLSGMSMKVGVGEATIDSPLGGNGGGGAYG